MLGQMSAFYSKALSLDVSLYSFWGRVRRIIPISGVGLPRGPGWLLGFGLIKIFARDMDWDEDFPKALYPRFRYRSTWPLLY